MKYEATLSRAFRAWSALRGVQMAAALRPPTRHTTDRVIKTAQVARLVAEGVAAELADAAVDVFAMLAAVDLVPGVHYVGLGRHTGPTTAFEFPWSATIAATPLDGGEDASALQEVYDVPEEYEGQGQTPREALLDAVQTWLAAKRDGEEALLDAVQTWLAVEDLRRVSAERDSDELAELRAAAAALADSDIIRLLEDLATPAALYLALVLKVLKDPSAAEAIRALEDLATPAAADTIRALEDLATPAASRFIRALQVVAPHAVDQVSRGSICYVCGAPATCVGRYEAQAADQHACDKCCGHGNEDGHCVPVVGQDDEEGGAPW